MSGPRFIPRIDPSDIEQGSERYVAQRLHEGLNSEWSIYHSYCWLREERSHRSTRLAEGEADFVLLHRKCGLLVLEVKGGQVTFDAEAGHWWQDGHEMKDPFKQAQTNLHALKEQIERRAHFVTPGRFPCPHGYAAAFPNANYQGTLPAGAHPAILFCARDMGDLGSKVQQALRHWDPASAPQEMHERDFQQMKEALNSTFRLVPSLARDVERDEEILVQLTEEQAEGLEAIYSNRRMVVEGTAGSGKTMLALERARAFAREGKSVLFLCYTRKLADWLRRRAAGIEGLKVANFHALCFELCQKAGRPFEPPQGEDPEAIEHFWTERAAELLLDATDVVSERYDAVVVDEGQDFRDPWWTALEALQREPDGPLYIFLDRDQNLWRTELRLPDFPRFRLDINCRNTRNIARTCGKILGCEIRVHRRSPEGVPPEVREIADSKAVRAGCLEVVKRVIGQQGLSPSRVAILSPYRLAKSCLGAEPLDQFPLTDDLEEWQKGNAIWYSTLRTFKGLEADVVLLVDMVDFRDNIFEERDLFVACSRARHRLYVFTSSKQVLAALAGRRAAV